MVKHIVLFNLTPEAKEKGEAAIQEITQAFAGLRGKIEGLLLLQTGVNYKETGRQFALYCEFDTREHEGAYQSHPLHEEVKRLTNPYLCDRVAADFEV